MQKAVAYILRHLHEGKTLGEIAKEVELSETYFSSLFKKKMGITVTEFVQESKVYEAKNLLQYSQYSIAEVSKYLGFYSQSHFSRVFKKYTELTPGEFRKEFFKSSW